MMAPATRTSGAEGDSVQGERDLWKSQAACPPWHGMGARGFTTGGDDDKEKGKPRREAGQGGKKENAASGNNREWRDWINKRVSELEEEGVLTKGDYEKGSGKGNRSPQRQHRGPGQQQKANKSALHLAILEELKKLPSPDPYSGFGKLGEREEAEEAAAELLAELAAAAENADPAGDEEQDAAKVGGVDGAQKGRGPAKSFSSDDKKAKAGRINPNRLFFPGQTYELEDLDPFSNQPRTRAFQPFRRKRQLFDDEVSDSDDLFLRSLHFLNYDLLSRYVTEQGKILPRRKTRLQKKVQRKLVRTIKTARQMAILPINSRVREDDFYDV